jgi:hypothetical protein
MARKPFVVTEEMREKVRAAAARGVPQESIAADVDCDPKTLRKHFRKELDRGAAQADAQIAGFLFDSAMAGNIAAQIFLAKVRLHWRESKAPEIPDAEQNWRTVIVLPDNNRDSGFMGDRKKRKRSVGPRNDDSSDQEN